MKNRILKFLVGKNLPHLARVACTFIGGWLLAGPLFSPDAAPLAPGLGGAAVEIGAPSAAEVRDGLTVGEVLAAAGGLLLIWASRFISFIRARNFDRAAAILGPLIGRSVPSLIRAVLVVLSAWLARFTADPSLAPETLAAAPLASVLASLAAVLFANYMSATEDQERNPVDPPLIARPATVYD